MPAGVAREPGSSDPVPRPIISLGVTVITLVPTPTTHPTNGRRGVR
jgi:hypothetical protein